MRVPRKIYRQSPGERDMPQPYTPTPDGFERRLRAWVRLPEDDVCIPGGASSSPDKHGVRDHAGRIAPRRKNHPRRRGRPDA
jgi:hypothetical protein